MIRNLHLSDFLKLGRLHEANVGLDVFGSLILPHSPRGAALSQHLPVPVQSFNSSIYIYEEPEGKPCAFLQTRARQRRDEWDILALGTIGKAPQVTFEAADNLETVRDKELVSETVIPEPDQAPSVDNRDEANIVESPEPVTLESSEVDQLNPNEDEAAEDDGTTWPSISEAEVGWLKLLEHLVIDAGERGVLRVYARLLEDSPELDLFTQAGFHSFTHESLYRLNYKVAVEKPAEIKLRSQRSRDLFSIDQLYRTVTPNQIQYAEAPNSSSRSWTLSRNYFPRVVKEQGYVLEENDKVVAYLRTLNHRNRHLFTIMCMDNRRESLPEIISYGLSNIKAGEDVQVYCAVREYEAEQETVLEDFGFEYFGKQLAMVKHIVQYIKNPERALAHARDHKLELAHSVIKSSICHVPKSGHYTTASKSKRK